MEKSVNNQKAQSTKLKKRTQEKSKHLSQTQPKLKYALLRKLRCNL